MEKPLQITIRGMEHSAALDAHIREKALKLEQFYPRMTDCHVMVEQPHRHHQQGSQLDVRIDIHLPGRTEVVVNHRPRRFGQSKYGLSRTFRVVSDLVKLRRLMREAVDPATPCRYCMKSRKSSSKTAPPPVLAGSKLLAYAVLDKSIPYANRGSLFVDGACRGGGGACTSRSGRWSGTSGLCGRG